MIIERTVEGLTFTSSPYEYLMMSNAPLAISDEEGSGISLSRGLKPRDPKEIARENARIRWHNFLMKRRLEWAAKYNEDARKEDMTEEQRRKKKERLAAKKARLITRLSEIQNELAELSEED